MRAAVVNDYSHRLERLVELDRAQMADLSSTSGNWSSKILTEARAWAWYEEHMFAEDDESHSEGMG